LKRFAGLAVALTAIAAFLVLWAGSASAIVDPPFAGDEDTTPVSGAYDMKDQSGTTNVTECPHAGPPRIKLEPARQALEGRY